MRIQRFIIKPLMGLIVILSLVSFSNCRKKIEWTPIEIEEKPVINSILTSGSPIKVHVSLSATFNSEPAPLVENATILLFANNVYIERLSYQDNGIYISSVTAEEEVEYRCEISIPKFETITCSTRIPKHQEIIKFNHINKASVNEEGITEPAVEITFNNNLNTDSYFQAIIKYEQYDDIEEAWLINQTDPLLLDEGLQIAVFNNEMIEDSLYTMIIHYTTGSASNHNNEGWVRNLFPVHVELRTIHSDYYEYIKQKHLYEISNDEPMLSVGVSSTFNIHSNIVNGYGIFTGFSSFVTDTIHP